MPRYRRCRYTQTGRVRAAEAGQSRGAYGTGQRRLRQEICAAGYGTIAMVAEVRPPRRFGWR